MSKALGGAGHEEIRSRKSAGAKPAARTTPIARHWLGDYAARPVTVFQWHGETFSIPPGATRLFANQHCANQMFALGPHLGMQCHVEMTAGNDRHLVRAMGRRSDRTLPTSLACRRPEVMQADRSANASRHAPAVDQFYVGVDQGRYSAESATGLPKRTAGSVAEIAVLDRKIGDRSW